MSRFLYILCFLLINTKGEILDKRITLKVRHGIEKAIGYIDTQYKRVNEDCLFGVVLSIAVIADSYRNGTHVMDTSTLNIILKLLDVLQKSLPYIDKDRIWIAESILIPSIWQKDIKYKYNDLSVFSKIKDYQVLEKIRKYQNDKKFLTNMDFCLKDVTNITHFLRPKKCYVDDKCWEIYNRDDGISSGYILTHKLLLTQLAKNRNCLIPEKSYERKIRELCSRIFSEVSNGDYFDELDRMFDLFLEEVILCGYEGYADFLSNKWLIYILKSQRASGCFSAVLTDDLKTKIKRTTNIFEDGCADHTTGIGLAVLSLYYNFIIKEIFV